MKKTQNLPDQFVSSWVFDLDHTICIPDDSYGNSIEKYKNAKPIGEVIEKIRKLSANGDYIIIHTARRMKTFENDIKLVREAVEALTRRWLNDQNVPFDELIFGKPYATNFYVDDKAMNVKDFLKNV